MSKYFVFSFLALNFTSLISKEQVKTSNENTQETYVGIISYEKIETYDKDGSPDKGNYETPKLRVLFKNSGESWLSAKSDKYYENAKDSVQNYPNNLEWTIAFDGKNLGIIKSNNNKELITSHFEIGVQQILSSNVPKIKTKKLQFCDFDACFKYRPLVVVSKPNFKDPNIWKPKPLNEKELSEIKSAFKKEISYVDVCKPLDEELTRYKILDEDIKLIINYTSNNGNTVSGLELKLKKELTDCFDTSQDSNFSSHWFYKDKSSITLIKALKKEFIG